MRSLVWGHGICVGYVQSLYCSVGCSGLARRSSVSIIVRTQKPAVGQGQWRKLMRGPLGLD